jgi:glycosyltransferase involved in cell wall biosynthesis
MVEISVVVPCYNAVGWITETLQSVVKQGLDNLEIIVIDDGSTDESAKIIERDFPLARLIKTKNQGASKARNLGTSESRGKFIQYLDADDLLAPGKLKRQLEILETSGADVAYGDWQVLINTPDGRCLPAGVRKRKMQHPEIELFTDFWCPPAVYLFRRSIVEKVGSWSTNLVVIQDARFTLDCALRGARFIYCEGIMAYYRVHSKNSLSRRDSVAFARDCLQNAVEVENWWLGHGGINKERKAALLQVYDYISWMSFKKDKPTFAYAYSALNNLEPGYIPFRNKILRLIYKRMGYKTAASFAFWYRRIRNFSFVKKNRYV